MEIELEATKFEAGKKRFKIGSKQVQNKLSYIAIFPVDVTTKRPFCTPFVPNIKFAIS